MPRAGRPCPSGRASARTCPRTSALLRCAVARGHVSVALPVCLIRVSREATLPPLRPTSCHFKPHPPTRQHLPPSHAATGARRRDDASGRRADRSAAGQRRRGTRPRGRRGRRRRRRRDREASATSRHSPAAKMRERARSGPTAQHRALEPGAGTRAALGDADDLASVDRHLARAEPAKQTALDHGVRTIGPRVHGPARRARQRRAHTSPSQCAARPTSSSQSGSPAGSSTSTHSTSPGRTSTAPPPLRRRHDLEAAARVDPRGCAALPEDERGRGRLEDPHRPLDRIGNVSRVEARPPSRSALRPTTTRSRGERRAGLEVRLPVLGHAADRTTTHASSRGADGRRRRCIVVSSRRRSRLRMLHGRQAATTFSHTCSPPRLRGMTWSMRVGVPAAVLAACSSRANTARAAERCARWNGTLTK